MSKLVLLALALGSILLAPAALAATDPGPACAPACTPQDVMDTASLVLASVHQTSGLGCEPHC